MRRPAALAAVLALAMSGCAASGLSFVQDERVQDLRPRPGDTVKLPFDLTWSVRDFDGRFAVFFDTRAMRPGKDLLSLVPEDDPCRTEPECPTTTWLNERGIHVTDEPRLHVELLPDRRKNNRSKDRHEAVVVLLDAENRRVGEAAFVTEFVVDRED
ncbi:MAG TPA: hypothetical protein VHF47_08900 [Acidimicrobiales bacterium]|nr:hypothetical protein [Acidimicrobiales bacterium]